MPKFDDYTQKTTPEDNDIALILDKTANVNKKTPFSGIWTWIVNKMTNAVIQNLQTTNKTVVGAINELNSKTFQGSNEIITSDVDWNTINEAGVYKVQCVNGFAEGKNVPMITSISDFYNFGVLLVFKPVVDDENRLIQIYIPDIQPEQPYRARIAIRSFNLSFRTWGMIKIENTL